MKRSILKPVLFGVLFGTAAFFAPFFLLKTILFVMLIGLIFRIFWWRSGGWHWHHHRMQYHFAYADKLRGMTDEEYAAFKSKASGYDCYGNEGCDHRMERKSSAAGSTETTEKNNG